MNIDLTELEKFIGLAKSQTYVGNAESSNSSRLESHDVRFKHGQWLYLDSYFGGTDFIGQEVVWESSVPVWAMNYYGRIVLSDKIDAQRAGETIKLALSEMYQEGRFLGGFRKETKNGCYIDASKGTVESFIGGEKIVVDGLVAYQLDYHGGLVKP